VAGFGKSKSANFGSRRDFMEQFMKAVKLDRPVLICASMSGSFALPFVLRPEAATCTQRLRGFVPIAPVGTSQFSAADYGSCKVSLMPELNAGLCLHSESSHSLQTFLWFRSLASLVFLPLPFAPFSTFYSLKAASSHSFRGSERVL